MMGSLEMMDFYSNQVCLLHHLDSLPVACCSWCETCFSRLVTLRPGHIAHPSPSVEKLTVRRARWLIRSSVRSSSVMENMSCRDMGGDKSRDPKRTLVARCGHCNKTEGKNEKFSRCSRCQCVYYCCKQHQRDAWEAHKKICEPMPAPGTREFSRTSRDEKGYLVHHSFSLKR